MNLRRVLFAIAIAFALNSSTSQAAIIISDTFETNGALVGTTPSPGPGLVWQSLSGTAGSLIVSSNAAQIRTIAAADQDGETDFVTAQTGTLYAGFTLNMSTRPTSTGGDYFASFRSGTSYVGRIFAGIPTGTGASSFRFGISNSTTTSTFLAQDFALNTDYRVVVRLTEAGALDFTTLWVNPADESSSSVSTTAGAISTSLSAFAFRQDGSATHGGASIDNLIVATTFAEAAAVIPEPNTIALGTLAGLGFLGYRLRRKQS